MVLYRGNLSRNDFKHVWKKKEKKKKMIKSEIRRDNKSARRPIVTTALIIPNNSESEKKIFHEKSKVIRGRREGCHCTVGKRFVRKKAKTKKIKINKK